MDAQDLTQAKRIRFWLIAIGSGLFILAVLGLFWPATAPILIRCFSSAACLVAAVAWLCILFRKTLARCLLTLVIVNFIALGLISNFVAKLPGIQERAILDKFFDLKRAPVFKDEIFLPFVRHTTDTAPYFWIGIVALWILNLFALMIFAQTEREKESAILGSTTMSAVDSELAKNRPG